MDHPLTIPHPLQDPPADPTPPGAQADGSSTPMIWTPRVQLRASIAAGVLLLAGIALAQTPLPLAGEALTWASLAIGLLYGVRAALEALAERRIDIDVLMVVGAALAAGIGHPGEGALLMFLFTLSGALEDLAMARTRREIEALHRLMPTEAIVWRGGWVEAEPESLRPGERIKIRPGELVPTDARIITGESLIDQSTLTGESIPREVREGDDLYAGAVNLDNPIEAEVLRPAAVSSLQKILNLVMEAREQREPVQRLIDRLGQPYAIGVMAASLAVLLVWWLLFGDTPARAAYTAITFLIVLSPCALMLATPTATLCAIARGARAGVLFKGGHSIERLSRTGAVCFDKTGTLTFGRAALTEVHPVGWSDADRLIAVAAGLEADSTHPIARAVREGAERRAIAPAPVLRTSHAAGRGVTGALGDDAVAVGSYELVEPIIPVCLRARTRDLLMRTFDRGRIGAVVAAGDRHGEHGAAAVLVIADGLRPGAADMVRELHALGIAPVRMLTGDHRAAAQKTAELLAIDRWDAELLPEDKLRIVREMRADARAPGRPRRAPGVAFIGDGVNDAPALSTADVGIAIGSIGSDAALESADIVLLNDNLACVPWAIRLARRTRAILRFNIALAMGVIVLMGLATLVGSRIGLEVPMALGVVAHEGGTLFVVANAMRLLWAPGVPTR